jgi:WD40 repeat protein
LIKDIVVTQEGDIISASEDKTIRVWDSATGKEKRKILGQIGAGDEGKIFAIALSPNEEFLTVGGFLAEGHGVNDNLVGTIRIYNYQSGKLLKVLKSHTDVVYDLAFSSDGKYLISGSSDRTAKIWRVEDFTLQDTIEFHKKQVHAVKIIKKDGNYFAVTAGYDNQIALS